MSTKKIKQKNLENRSLDMNTHIAFMPKKIRKDWEKRRTKNKLVKVKRITKCTRCSKPILPPFGGALCGDCMKQWDIQTWARILARYHQGKATKCIKCGLVANKGIEWHHWDYTKPLEVISLCKKCHGMAHRLSKEKFENTIVKKRMNEFI